MSRSGHLQLGVTFDVHAGADAQVRATLVALVTVDRAPDAVAGDVVHAVRVELDPGGVAADGDAALSSVAESVTISDDRGSWRCPVPLLEIGQLAPWELVEQWLVVPLPPGTVPVAVRFAAAGRPPQTWWADGRTDLT